MSLPKEKEPLQHPRRGPHGNSQGTGAVNCCRKDLYPEVAGILDSLHFYVSAT